MDGGGSAKKRRLSEEGGEAHGDSRRPKLTRAEEAILLTGPRTGYQLWKRSRAGPGKDRFVKIPNTQEGWRMLPMKDKLPFEERSKAEHEMYDVANFKGSKESWVLYITDIIQRGEDKYSPYEMMREGLGPEKLPPADAPKEVHDAYWNSISENQQAEWTQKSLSRIKKRRKQFMAGKLTNWTETAPMTGAAHLAVVQDALKNCAADAANVDPVDAMLDTFMSTVPSLLNVLAEDGVESSKLGRLMAQPLLLPGITNFCGTLPFLDPKSD